MFRNYYVALNFLFAFHQIILTLALLCPPPPSPASHVYEYFSMVPLNIKSLIIINRERGLYGKILNRGFMLGGSQCNVLHCVLWRHLYVDLQLCVLTIYWTTRMNTDRTKC